MFKLIRVVQNEHGIFGVLIGNDNIPLVTTAERKWENNLPNVSCIPEGHYTCKRTESSKFGTSFEVCDVLSRTHIIFHIGNFPVKNSKGCILLGTTYNSRGIGNSRVGFTIFMESLEGIDEFELEITQCF